LQLENNLMSFSFRFFGMTRGRRARRRPAAGAALYAIHKETARVRVHEKLAQWNSLYVFEYKKVAIRNSRSRWGSCSRAGNLNFNYKILFLPEHLQDYVIVHELAHLAEFNHSPAFWEVVARTIPEHKKHREELRQIRIVVPRKAS
jgi:predicted metal-dependent hydrolase